MSTDSCSVCGVAVDEYARGGGPHNAKCVDCRFDKPAQHGTVEYARKNGIPPHGNDDDGGGAFA